MGSGGRHSPTFDGSGIGEEGTVITANGRWHGGASAEQEVVAIDEKAWPVSRLCSSLPYSLDNVT